MGTQERNDDPLPAEDLPPFDDGPAVLVSMKATPPVDERARAYAELQGYPQAPPDGGDVGSDDADGDAHDQLGC